MDYPSESKFYDLAQKINGSQISLKDWYTHGRGKAVGIITDKQSVICTEKIIGFGTTHEELGSIVNSVIYNEQYNAFNSPSENIFWATTTGRNITFVVYSESNMSYNQYIYLCNILDEIDDYNQTVQNKVELLIFVGNKTISTDDVNIAKEELKLCIDYQKITLDKYIIGTHLKTPKKKL